jgi:hypothetical protein
MASAQPKSTKKEGDIYISSTGLTWTSDLSTRKHPTAEKLKKYSENIYGAGITEKQLNLIFQDYYSISVYNEKSEKDEDLSSKMFRMTEKIDLWTHMQKCYMDVFWFGPYILNPVWKFGDGDAYPTNEYYISELRRLPPESFAPQYSTTYEYSNILKGIVLNEETKAIEYWQTDTEGNQIQIKNVFMIKHPRSSELAGTPLILPIVPVITMLDYAWLAQMQRTNRTGSPLLFLRIDSMHPDASEDDEEYGRKVLQHWGKDTAFTLRPNMELIDPKITDRSDNLKTISSLAGMIIDYFSPGSYISKDGTLIGGSSGSELELLLGYIRGIHSWITKAFEKLLQTYLTSNGYKDYTVEIKIPLLSVDRSEMVIKALELGRKEKAITKSELRELLPIDLSPLTDDIKEELEAEALMISPISQPTQTSSPNATDDNIDDAQEQQELQHKEPKPEKIKDKELKEVTDDEINELTAAVVTTRNRVMELLKYAEEAD